MSKKPSRIADYLAKTIDALAGHKSQKQIAEEVGYEKANMISMFKKGDAKVPLEKVPVLAKAIGIDPAFLFRLGLEQYWPDQHEAIASVFGEVITQNERALIRKIRSWNRNTDPILVTKDNEGILRDLFKS